MKPARIANVPKTSSRIRALRTFAHAPRASWGACGPGGGEAHGELAMSVPEGGFWPVGDHAAAGAGERPDGAAMGAVAGGGTVVPQAGQKATPDGNALPHFEQ
jgi:hypothetical protein